MSALAITALFAAAPACSSSSGKGSSTTSATGGSSTTSATRGSTTGPTWSCSAKGICPNDTAPTASQIQDCQANLSDPDCGSAFKAEAVCNFSNAECDDAGMSEASQSCQSADLAWANCMLGDAGTD